MNFPLRLLPWLTAAIALSFSPKTLASPAVLSASEGSQINIRSGPSTQSSSPHYGLPGDRVEVLRSTRGEGGYTWYYVRFNVSGATGWVREDLIAFLNNGSTALNSRTSSGGKQPTILEGIYWIGPTDLGLRVKGKQYQLYDEAGADSWKSVSMLKPIKEGVILEGSTYWCLSTLPHANGKSKCSPRGWVPLR